MQNLVIRPSRDLRNHYPEMARLCKENNTAVAVTVNGHQDTVLISHEQFMQQQLEMQEMKARMELYAKIAQSEEDIRQGRVYDADKVYSELIAKLETLR